MGMTASWSTSHLIMGDPAQINVWWYDDGNIPTTQPTSWYIRAANNSGGAGFFEATFPCTPGDGTATTYTWTPTAWGYTTGGNYKRTDFLIQALDASGNSMGINYGPGNMTHYEMPTISVTASPSTVTSYGQQVTFSWSADKNLDKVEWDRGIQNNSTLFNLYGRQQSQPQSGTTTVTQGGSYLPANVTSNTFTFTASHGFNSPYYVPNAINSRLNASASVTVSVVIPVYGIGAAKTLYTEGETMYCAVSTTNVAAGTTVYWAIEGITGTLTGSDFIGDINGGFQLDSGGGYTWSVGIANDTIPEGGEQFRLKLYTDASRTNQVAQSSITTIITSDQPSYGISAAQSVYDEGDTVYCGVSTSNVAVGTTLYYRITGAAINALDFTSGGLEGQGNISSSGTFTFNRGISNDITTENTETFKLQLFTNSARTTLVAESPLYSIIDTSQSQSVTITPSMINVVEGGSITYTVNTTGYPPGTAMYWAMEGSGITSSDFTPVHLYAEQTLVGINGGFEITKNIVADQLTEGSELIYFRVMYPTSGVGDIVATNVQVSILDTSTNPPLPAPTINFYASPTEISVGQSSTLHWNVTNADTVTINQGVGSVPNSSNTVVSPTTTTVYTLSASGPGGSNSATVTIDTTLPVALMVTGPSTVDWQAASIPIQISASNAPNIILYATYDGVVKPEFEIPNSSGSVTFSPYNYIPDWSSPVDTIQLHFAAGATANQTLVIAVDVDRTPDPIILPASPAAPEEEVTSPPVPVAVTDIDVPVEIKANEPIKVQINGTTNWNNVREI